MDIVGKILSPILDLNGLQIIVFVVIALLAIIAINTSNGKPKDKGE